MSFQVFLTDDAARDLEGLYDYIDIHDVSGKADYVLDQIEQVIFDLSEYPDRGSFPKELVTVGISEYREVFFKPYRIIYRVVLEKVYIMVIVDGRRDMEALLQRRLLKV